MIEIAKYAGQAAFYLAVAVFVGALASWPRLPVIAPDTAQIKVSFVHGSKRMEECRRLTSEEIARLPPSERRPNTCGRKRIDIRLQLEVDGRVIYDRVLPPTGIAADGPAHVYEKFNVASGRHVILVRMRDSNRAEGFDYEGRAEVALTSLQSLAVDFKGDQGAFVFR